MSVGSAGFDCCPADRQPRELGLSGVFWGIAGHCRTTDSPTVGVKSLISLFAGLSVTVAPYRGDMPWRQSPLRGVPVAVAMRGAIR